MRRSHLRKYKHLKHSCALGTCTFADEKHDFSLMNTKAFANLKGSGGNIWEVFEVLDDVRRAIFRDTVFGYFIDIPRLQGDALLFHKMFLHQIRPNPVLSPDGIKPLDDVDAVRIWIYEMIPAVRACGFASRKNKDLPRMKRWSGTKKLEWVEVNKIWSKMQEGLPPRQNMLPGDGEMTSSYYMSFQEYVYGEGKTVSSPVRDHFRRQDESSSSMSSSGRSHGRGRGSGRHNLDEVLKWLHALEQHVFMNRQPTEVFVEEVNNEQFWNDIIFDDPTVSQRNYDEQVVQDEVMNKNNTTEDVFGDIQDDKVLEKRNEYVGNKFDDDVFDVNDYSEVKEEWEERNDNAGNKFDDDVPDEDELIITGIVDYFDDDDDKEVTPDKPRSRKPSQYLCPPYTEIFLHTTPKQKRRTKKKVDIKSTSPVPPPVFGVAHDFSMLRLQPYVAGASMEVHIYDSLGRGAYEKFKSEGIFSKFERRVANYLDKIKYWARRNIPRIPLNMQFIYEENVPQQSSHLGDCGVFVCMFMEQLVSGQLIRVLIDPKNTALEFRLRMAKIIWGSSLGPM
uniref:Ubiquitin-like protease family profile domain-containing protein n=1 Tax=Lactuca sativa TaxID=4236 RepID=A0A9R1VN31_LACSA|nr:hypothetical protein LSAT_V11C400177930 [Lactuca sativa]